MTFTEEENINAELEEVKSPFPTVLGVTFTPIIMGAIVGVLGLGAAAFWGITKTLPAMGEHQNLLTQESGKERELEAAKNNSAAAEIARLEAEIEQVKQLKAEIFKLLGSMEDLDTILLDLNRAFASNRVDLISYQPAAEEPVDVGLGEIIPIPQDQAQADALKAKLENLNINLKKQEFTLTFESITFQQSQNLLATLERLQPLIVVDNFKSNVDEKAVLYYDANRNQLVPKGETTLKVNFGLSVLINPGEQPAPVEAVEGEAPAQ